MLLHERCQREDACRRIAACIADEVRPSDCITVQLGQSVDSLCLRIRVWDMIPCLIDRRVGKAIVCPEIDDMHRQTSNRLDQLHCMSMRKCDKENIAVLCDTADILHRIQYIVINMR